MLEDCTLVGRLVEDEKSFYKESHACVRVLREEGEYYPGKVGVRQGCARLLG